MKRTARAQVKARWALAPGGRVAHKWNRTIQSVSVLGAWWHRKICCGDPAWTDQLRPAGDAPRCKRCLKARGK